MRHTKAMTARLVKNYKTDKRSNYNANHRHFREKLQTVRERYLPRGDQSRDQGDTARDVEGI